MFSVARKCGRCNQLVDFRFEVVFEHTQRQVEDLLTFKHRKRNPWESPIDIAELKRNDQVFASTLSHCPRCFDPTMMLYQCSRQAHEGIQEVIKAGKGNIFGGESCVTILEVYPKPREPEKDPDWPQELIRQFADAQDMLVEKKTPSFVLVACRTVLDIATKELATEKRENLYDRINMLREKGIITESIRAWAHSIRLDGNKAVHEGVGDEEEAREYVDFLKVFLNVTFSLPRRIERKRKK